VRSAKGLEIVKRLIAVSDIVIENFSSRVLQSWGLGYDELFRIKPDIIYVSMSATARPGGITATRLLARSRRQSRGSPIFRGCQISRRRAEAGRRWIIPAACMVRCARSRASITAT
jgi:CoA-transferase family III